MFSLCYLAVLACMMFQNCSELVLCVFLDFFLCFNLFQLFSLFSVLLPYIGLFCSLSLSVFYKLGRYQQLLT